MEVPAPDFLAAQVNSYVGTSYFNGNLWVRRWSISRRMNKCLCEKDPILVENTSHTPDVYICLFFGFLVPLFHVFQLLFGCLAEWNVIRLKGLSLTIALVKTSEIKQECRVPTCTTFTDIDRRTFPELARIGWGYTCKAKSNSERLISFLFLSLVTWRNMLGVGLLRAPGLNQLIGE